VASVRIDRVGLLGSERSRLRHTVLPQGDRADDLPCRFIVVSALTSEIAEMTWLTLGDR